MANRWFNQFKGSLEKGVVLLDGYANIAADASVSASGIMGAKVSKVGTGFYDIVLEDDYVKLLAVQLTSQSSVTNANGMIKVVSMVNSTGTDVSATRKKVKTIRIATCNGAGVPTDSVVANVINISLMLKNSEV